jgi:Ca2+-binding EF-hand superfamily protein
MQEWMAFLSEYGLLDDRYPERLALEAFAIGAHVNQAEASSRTHLELTYPEFLLALAWVIYCRAGCRSGAVGRFSLGIQEVMGAPLAELHKRVISWSGNPAPTAGIEDKMMHWTIGAAWINKMWRLLQEIFQKADDNNDSQLSPRELRLLLQRGEMKGRLAELGVEIPHLASFFQLADRDGDGNLTITEALHGFALVKQRLHGDEIAIRFLRSWLTKADAEDRPGDGRKPGSGEAEWHSDQIIKKSFVLTLDKNPKFQSQKAVLGLDFNLMELWEFLEAEAGHTGDMDGFALDHVLIGYVDFRDPTRHGMDSTVNYLTELFSAADVDGSGYLDQNEFLLVISHPETLDKLQSLGVIRAGDQVQLEHDINMLFCQIDEDDSRSFTIAEIVSWFAEVREMIRQRELEERVAQLEKADKTKNVSKARTRPS